MFARLETTRPMHLNMLRHKSYMTTIELCRYGASAVPVYLAIGYGSMDARWVPYFLHRALDLRPAVACYIQQITQLSLTKQGL